MAIYHLATHTMSRRDGHNALAAAAYRSGVCLVDERSGEVFDFIRKRGVVSSQIVVPEGMQAPERAALWNAAEAAEKRKDARICREWRVALPHELDDAQRHKLTRALAQHIADRHGVAVDSAIHAPDRFGDQRNAHAHILATTRVIEPDGRLGKKATIEVANKDRKKLGIPGTSQGDILEMRAETARLINQALELAGHEARVDHRSYAEQAVELTPTQHLGRGAVALERQGIVTERLEHHQEDRARQRADILARPEIILDKITVQQAVFSRRSIAEELNRYIDAPQEFQNLLARLEMSPELVTLDAGREGRGARYTTREMLAVENHMVATAQHMADSSGRGVREQIVTAAIAGVGTLSAEQETAVRYVTGPARLSVVIGDAGTGKSFSMKVAREAFEADGWRVRGAALAGKAAAELQEGSGIESRTLASLERAWAKGRDLLTAHDVLVIDEAGMIGTRQMDRILHAARKARARVVLLGDDKQLAAIDAGAALRAIVDRTGAAEITEIRRQKHEWMRAASQELARGDMDKAIRAYADRGSVQMLDTREDAAQATAAAYVRDIDLGQGQIILTQTNAEVLRLNALVRNLRQARGELQGEASFRTSAGVKTFAAGDRILFRQNDSALGVMNGTLGTVLAAEKGRLKVRLDGEAARTIVVDAQTYEDISHGYAVTVHKSQGISVDRSYVLATKGVDRALAYVMATRHKQAMQMFGAAEDFMDRRAGRLLAHGRAPFENRPKARESYFVTLENPRTGKQTTIWGVDLERAIGEANPALGDSIRLDHCGSQSVRLPDGGTANRHTWAVRNGPDLALDGLIQRFSRIRKKDNALDFAQRRGIDKPSPEIIMEQQTTPDLAAAPVQERRTRLLPDYVQPDRQDDALAGRHTRALEAIYGEDTELVESLSLAGQVDPRDLAGMSVGAAEDALARLNRAEQIRELADAIELDAEYGGGADDLDQIALAQLRATHAADRAGLEALWQIEQSSAARMLEKGRQSAQEIEGVDDVENWKAWHYQEYLAHGLGDIASLAQASGALRDHQAFAQALEQEAWTREGARTFGQKIRAVALGEAEGKDALALAGRKNWLGKEDSERLAAREGLIQIANELSDVHSRTERRVGAALDDLRRTYTPDDVESWSAQRYQEHLARGLGDIASLAKASGSLRDPQTFVQALEQEAWTREGARTFGQKIRAVALGEAEGKDALALAGRKNWLGKEDAERLAAREDLVEIANELSDVHSRTERRVGADLADLRAADARAEAERRAPEMEAAIAQDRARQVERGREGLGR